MFTKQSTGEGKYNIIFLRDNFTKISSTIFAYEKHDLQKRSPVLRISCSRFIFVFDDIGTPRFVLLIKLI